MPRRRERRRNRPITRPIQLGAVSRKAIWPSTIAAAFHFRVRALLAAVSRDARAFGA